MIARWSDSWVPNILGWKLCPLSDCRNRYPACYHWLILSPPATHKSRLHQKMVWCFLRLEEGLLQGERVTPLESRHFGWKLYEVACAVIIYNHRKDLVISCWFSKQGPMEVFNKRCLLPTWNLTTPRKRWPLLVHIYNSVRYHNKCIQIMVLKILNSFPFANLCFLSCILGVFQVSGVSTIAFYT